MQAAVTPIMPAGVRFRNTGAAIWRIAMSDLGYVLFTQPG
jgi:hypothetical protein